MYDTLLVSRTKRIADGQGRMPQPVPATRASGAGNCRPPGGADGASWHAAKARVPMRASTWRAAMAGRRECEMLKGGIAGYRAVECVRDVSNEGKSGGTDCLAVDLRGCGAGMPYCRRRRPA